MGYTKFGKEIRKHMIDKDENLGTIANIFGVTTAFISAVLTGKKSIPDDWFDKLCIHYELNNKEKLDLYNAYCETKNMIKINMENCGVEQRKLALQFQKRLPQLSQDELNSIFEILGDDDT